MTSRLPVVPPPSARRRRLPLGRTVRCGAVLLVALARLAQAARLDVTVDRTQVYLHESLLLTIRVDGADQGVGEARFEASADAAFESLGSTSDSRVFIQTINGRMTRQDSVARVLTYRVTPRSSGELAIQRVLVDVQGRSLAAAGPTVRVIGVEPQSFVRLELAASREAVLVDEPFEVVLTVLAKRLASPNERHDPFAPNPPPKLEIPYLADAVPKGLQGPDASAVLQPLLLGPRGAFGFAINELTVRNDPFAMPFGFDPFGEPTPARFALSRDETDWNGAPAWRYRLTVRYTPQAEGSYTFGPVLFKGQSITGVRAGGAPELRDLFAVGSAVTVRVVPPPEAGRPASFIGSVGTQLVAVARLDTQQCKQGDPLTLTLDLTGAISLSNLTPPTLSLLPEFGTSFRVYDDAVRSEALDNGRRFVYTVRPLVAGTIELPSIPVSYYDTADRGYRTVRTDPIPLRVEGVAQFDLADIIDANPNAEGNTASIRVRSARTVPAAITAVPEGARSDGGPTLGQALRWLLPGPLVAGLAYLVRWIARHRRRWRRQRRRRRAASRAAARLRRVRSGADALRVAARFFEDRFDVAAAGFSPLDAATALREAQQPETRVAEVLAILQPLFDQSFRPDAPDPALLEKVRTELPGLLVRCGRVPTLPTGRTAPWALLLLGVALLAEASDEHLFLWNQANARMAVAAAPADFADAATLYRRLIDRGVHNGPVFRNYGTALLLAEAPEAAVDALLRAERHGGGSGDLRRNLELALAARAERAAAGAAAAVEAEGLPWTRVPLFWHYQLPLRLRVHILLLLYNTLWLAAVLRVLRLRAAGRGLAVSSLVGLVLFGSSVLVSVHQESAPLPAPVYRWAESPEVSR